MKEGRGGVHFMEETLLFPGYKCNGCLSEIAEPPHTCAAGAGSAAVESRALGCVRKPSRKVVKSFKICTAA